MKRYYVASIIGDIAASQMERLASEYVAMSGGDDPRSIAGMPSPLPGVSILYMCNAWSNSRADAERMAASACTEGSNSRVLSCWPHDVSDWELVRLHDDPGEFHFSPSTVGDMLRVLAGEVSA